MVDENMANSKYNIYKQLLLCFLLHLKNHHHVIIIVALGERADDDDDQHIIHMNVDDCSVIFNIKKMTSLSAEFSTEKECHLDFMQ